MSLSGFLPANHFFPAEMRQSTATTPTLADLDGDGRMDLVLRSKYGDQADVNGTPVQSIQAWHNTPAGWAPFASNPLQVDDGAGNLSPLTTDGGFAIADLDSDGTLELVATRATDAGSFQVYRLDGGALHELTGTDNPLDGVNLPDWDSATDDSVPGAVAVADYDSDGLLDIVVGSNRGETGLWAYRNTGSGYALDTTTFADVTLGTDTRIAPAFTDLDGDGHLDLVLGSEANTGSDKYGPGQVSAWTFDETTGKFAAAASDPFADLSVHRTPVPLFTDLDGDGGEDMVVGDKYGRLSAYHREADGSFTALDTPGSLTGVAGSPSFIDLNGDGKLDLIPSLASVNLTGASGFAPLENTGSGFIPFATNPFVDTPSSTNRAVAIDLDGDGDKDVLFAGGFYGGMNQAESFENQGGSYVRMATDPFASAGGAGDWADVEVADLNGDGREDLVVLDTDSDSFRVLLGSPSGFVEDTTNPLNGFDPEIDNSAGFAQVDLDGDGDLDLAVSDVFGALYTFENQGSGFAPFAANPISNGGPIGALPLWNGPVFTDVDGDGRLDFVGMDASLTSVKYGDAAALLAQQTPSVWLNTEAGWEKMAEAENPYRTVAIYPFEVPLLNFADLDGDGHLEAMQSEKYGNTQLIGVLGLQLALGTAAPEAMNGTADADILRGLAGADTLNGLDGDDVLAGGAGADRLNGGTDTDTADYNDSGAAVKVSLISNRGFGGDAEGDRLSSIENLAGSAFDDTLTGDSGSNKLEGRGGNDGLIGGGGADTLLGGDGEDQLRGGDDNDSLDGGAGADLLHGDAGADTLSGGDGADTLFGNEGDDSLAGGSEADNLAGGSGDDVLIGGLGADELSGGDGMDVFRFLSATEGGDRIAGYKRAEDVIEVSAAGFGGGLVEGVAAPFVANLTGLATSAMGVGQFIWDKDDRTLLWDADGAGEEAAVTIATFVGIANGSNGFNAGEIHVIA